MATSQLNLGSLNAGRRSNSEANMATTQRKPWQGQFLTSKHGHLTAQPVQVFDKQTWPPHSFSRGGFKLWGGDVSFEILRLPRFVHRNRRVVLPVRSPSVILARRRAQILHLQQNRH